MGQFSWMDCCNPKKQILDNAAKDVYLLVPKEFGGGHLMEPCYDGYGHFDHKDVYELIAEWNKEYIPTLIDHIAQGQWHCSTNDRDVRALENYYAGRDIHEGLEDYGILELRWIGIIMACYDEDNARLPYPIKVTYNKNAVYEQCPPSESDPNQGWQAEEDDEDEKDDDMWSWDLIETGPEHNMFLWNLLKSHFGHKVEIAIYGDPDNPASITLEDLDTNEVIIDAGDYTLTTRTDA